MRNRFDNRRWIYQVPARPRGEGDDAKNPKSETNARHTSEPCIAEDARDRCVARQVVVHSLKQRIIASSLCGIVFYMILYHCVYFIIPSSSSPFSTDLEPLAKTHIDEAVLRALRHTVERHDYASQADGAGVLLELTTPAYDEYSKMQMEQHPPTASLIDDLRVGQCWALRGDEGQLGLKLSKIIYPTHITIDHIPARFATHREQAPRGMVLWGAVDGNINEDRLRTTGLNTTLIASLDRSGPPLTYGHTYVPLALFEYDIHARSHVQTFSLDSYVLRSGIDVGVVVLQVISNWGGDNTCIYRVRVHGEPVLAP